MNNAPPGGQDYSRNLLWVVCIAGGLVFFQLWAQVCGLSGGLNLSNTSMAFFGFLASVLAGGILVFFTAGPIYFVCKKANIVDIVESPVFTWINKTLRNKSLFIVGLFAIVILVGAGYFYGVLNF